MQSIKIVMGTLFGVVLILSLLLGIHLLAVNKAPAQDDNSARLSRIDFQESLDSASAQNISNFVSSLDGVQKTYLNSEDGILVYSYFPLAQTPANIYSKVAANFSVKSKPYLVDAEQLKSGCPVDFSSKNPLKSLFIFLKSSI